MAKYPPRPKQCRACAHKLSVVAIYPHSRTIHQYCTRRLSRVKTSRAKYPFVRIDNPTWSECDMYEFAYVPRVINAQPRKCRRVVAYTADGIRVFESAAAAAQWYGIPRRRVYNSIERGREVPSAEGVSFAWEEEEN